MDDAANGATAALTLLVELVRRGERGETAIQDGVARMLEAAGLEVEVKPYRPSSVALIEEFASPAAMGLDERSYVAARLAGRHGGPGLLLFAHPDTEPPIGLEAWRRPPFAGIVERGRVYGWGVADDLAGVAAMLAAVRNVVAKGARPKRDLWVLSTPSKRHARGIHAFLAAAPPLAEAVYVHPAESGRGLLDIKAFASGLLEFDVIVEGRAPPTEEPGHTAFAHLGSSPVDRALEIAAALRALDRARAESVRHPALDERVGRASNLLIAGIDTHPPRGHTRVPTVCTLRASLTFPPSEDLGAIKAAIAACVAGADRGDGAPPVLRWHAGTAGSELPTDHPLYRRLAGAIATTRGAVPSLNPLHTSSDIRNPMVQRAVPTLGFGPLCGDLVQNGKTDEWVDIGEYLLTVAILEALIEGRA